MARKPSNQAEIAVGDIILARAGKEAFHAVVKSIRLGRLAVERCDGHPTGPVSVRDVAEVFKPAGTPRPGAPKTERLRPTAQMRMDLDEG